MYLSVYINMSVWPKDRVLSKEIFDLSPGNAHFSAPPIPSPVSPLPNGNLIGQSTSNSETEVASFKISLRVGQGEGGGILYLKYI